jgi:hypothetical protein
MMVLERGQAVGRAPAAAAGAIARRRHPRCDPATTGVVLRLAGESLLRYYDAAPALYPAGCRVTAREALVQEDFVARALPAGGLARFNGIVTISRDRIPGRPLAERRPAAAWSAVV